MDTKPTKTLVQQRKLTLHESNLVAPMGSWKWTESKHELLWSEGLHKIFTTAPKQELPWKIFLENAFPEDVLLVENCLQEVKKNTNGVVVEYRITKGDKTVHLSLTAKAHGPLNDEISGSIIDITNQKEYENELEERIMKQSKAIEELTEAEKKYRSIFERSSDPAFFTNIEFTLTEHNSAFLTSFGDPESAEKIAAVKDLFVSSEDYTHFTTYLKETERVHDFEVSLQTKSGVIKRCVLNCVFIPNKTSDFSCYQVVIHELTSHKQLDAVLLQTERLSLTDKTARSIAHDVRNPLTNLNLALDQLRCEMPADSEPVKACLEVIERNALRIEKLVGEMLESTKQKQLHLKLTAVNELLKDTLKLAHARIEFTKIVVETTYEKNLPRILIDKGKIQVALLNIIINALEACEPGKGVVKIDAHVKNNILTVVISDNGKGISEIDLPKLFDPFHTGKETGIGMGLAASKKILNSHSVTMEIKSVVNKGTTFYIHFKLAE